jgi:hypothetical protein
MRIWMQRQEVDDVYPIVASFVAVAHQAGGDRVAISLVPNQDAPEIVGSLRVERLEEAAEVAVPFDQIRHSDPLFCYRPPKGATATDPERAMK